MSAGCRMGLASVLAAPLLCLASCDSAFAPASELSTVHVLGIRSDTPFVRPGATFETEVLAYDGRPDKSRPMRLFWLKDVCYAPKDAMPEDCYRQFGSTYASGQDLTPRLTEGSRASFQMPADGQGTLPRPGTLPTALVFVAACAGHLEFVGSPVGYPGAVPFACVDGGRRLDAKDFVFGFLRLFVSAEQTNRNPAPSGVTIDGVALPVGQPLTLPRCTSADLDDCPARKLAVTIGDEEQEIDPLSAPPGSAPLREHVWSSFYATAGKLESEALVLFDGRHGRTQKAENEYRGPNVAGDVDLFVVTHDDRSGAAFQSFRLKAE